MVVIQSTDRELAAPPTGTKLKHVLLGHGYQNYTCTQAEQDGPFTSTATGALAVLYDVWSFFPAQGASALSLEGVFGLANEAAQTDVPLNIEAEEVEGRIDGAAPAVVKSNPWIAPADVTLPSAGAPLKFKGVHYFDNGGVPTFDLGSDFFRAKKLDDLNAPATAGTSKDGSKAVKWLLLGDAGGSTGIQYVYRVNTVGGAGHTCSSVGDDSTEYATFYYLYG
ncbi:unnamed protein product [Parascedosporium putredinis]|uniref:Malate dehydrogenase n=1 Tax=Parascedosporium putredinis TaxID=1442378 RepID=A0A9P1GXK7_9PEZI|nr:unnamed protein product [Parascedosporium putredinis]CAI7989940.1 unnamed protein product [Parascedosporium putredinis]